MVRVVGIEPTKTLRFKLSRYSRLRTPALIGRLGGNRTHKQSLRFELSRFANLRTSPLFGTPDRVRTCIPGVRSAVPEIHWTTGALNGAPSGSRTRKYQLLRMADIPILVPAHKLWRP